MSPISAWWWPAAASTWWISRAPASRALRSRRWTRRVPTRGSCSSAPRRSRWAPPVRAGRSWSGSSTARPCSWPSSSWAARRRRSRWRGSTRSAASLSDDRSGRSRRSSTSWPTCTWASSWRARTLITARGRSRRTRPSCPWPPPPRAWPRAKPTTRPPRRISRSTAAWASPGNSTATCTTAAPTPPR